LTDAGTALLESTPLVLSQHRSRHVLDRPMAWTGCQSTHHITNWPHGQLVIQPTCYTVNSTRHNSSHNQNLAKNRKLKMWANAQRDGCPAEYRWRPLFNVAKFGWLPLLECRAVTLPRSETS